MAPIDASFVCMARPLRIEFEGALYHVTARGDRREPIYDDDEDRQHFLVVLGDVVERFNWVCHAYCLMANHHLCGVPHKICNVKFPIM